MMKLKQYQPVVKIFEDCFEGADFEIEIESKLITDCGLWRVEYGAWINRKDYGVKHFMFGASGKDISYDAFVEMVENNLDEYEESYLEEVE